MKVFAYDDLLRPETQQLLNLHPISEEIAETSGKLYKVGNTPMFLLPNDITHVRGIRRVLGAILTFDDSDRERALNVLDNFEGCSMSRIGRQHPHDLTRRLTLKVYPIIARSIHELENVSYTYKQGVECLVYAGNPNHEAMVYAIRVDRHNKYTQGYYPSGFINILKRKGY